MIVTLYNQDFMETELESYLHSGKVGSYET